MIIGMALSQGQLQEAAAIAFNHLGRDIRRAIDTYLTFELHFFGLPVRAVMMWPRRWNSATDQFIIDIDLGNTICYEDNICLAMIMEQLGLVHSYRIHGRRQYSLDRHITRLNHLSLYLSHKKFVYVGPSRCHTLFGIKE